MSSCGRPGAVLRVMALMIASGIGVAPARAVDFGSLEITTQPGTSILWDDNLLGVTDDSGRMTISEIPLGRYSITLRHDGFEVAVRDMDVHPGSQVIEVPLHLPTSFANEPETVAEGFASEPPLPLPDPFARSSSPLISVTLVSFLVVIGAGALWMGLRRRTEPVQEIPPQPEGPRVVMAEEPRGRRRSPRFYEDLRQRETMLEDLEERGPGRPRPKVIELPVTEHRPMEEDG